MTRLLTASEAAAQLRRAPATIRGMARRGRLPCICQGQGSPMLFRQEDIDAYVKSCTREVPASPLRTCAVGVGNSVRRAIERASHENA